MTLVQQGWLLSIGGLIVTVVGIVCLVLGAQLLVEADAVAEAKAFHKSMRPYRITLPLEHEYEGQNEMEDRWYRNWRDNK